jgi:predicted kinase
MKPKLVVINGPCGIGKNTIAEKYKSEHETALILDIDEVRRQIDGYRENREKSLAQAYESAYILALDHLNKGGDVIIPKLISNPDVLEKFREVAKKCEANFYEIVLWTDKKEAIERAVKRGFRPGSLLQEDKLESMYDELEEILKNRKNAIVIQTAEGKIEETYKLIENLVYS